MFELLRRALLTLYTSPLLLSIFTIVFHLPNTIQKESTNPCLIFMQRKRMHPWGLALEQKVYPEVVLKIYEGEEAPTQILYVSD